jgi:hypothetical protein
MLAVLNGATLKLRVFVGSYKLIAFTHFCSDIHSVIGPCGFPSYPTVLIACWSFRGIEP